MAKDENMRRCCRRSSYNIYVLHVPSMLSVLWLVMWIQGRENSEYVVKRTSYGIIISNTAIKISYWSMQLFRKYCIQLHHYHKICIHCIWYHGQLYKLRIDDQLFLYEPNAIDLVCLSSLIFLCSSCNARRTAYRSSTSLPPPSRSTPSSFYNGHAITDTNLFES